ncbi:MAG: AbrB/MazE/SpoVT family DNA-binding domain-containing protein [Armatimonadota bacterium]|nr:AbrB/MazE/SpoVT family DNA-binding domain-containing protein [bacterium]
MEDSFYGTVTVGERGQIVIPSEARKDLSINPGDKMLVVKHPGANIIGLCKIGDMSNLLNIMLQQISEFESNAAGTPSEPTEG